MSLAAKDDRQRPKADLAPGPLFVVSMWRSGSSLLYALLNKHPQVGLMYEADLLLLRAVFLKPKALCDWAERWEFWNEAFHRHGLAVTDVAEGISNFPQAFAATHQLFAQRKGATIWGDKSPNYYDRLNEMADDFPEARFIIVWRDPKGTVNSILRAASLGNSYFSRAGAAHCGLLGYEVLKRECDCLVARGKAVCQVHYEDLVRDTPLVMRQVCEFLAIPYDDSLSKLEGADRSAIFEGKHHLNVKGDKIVDGARPQLASAAVRTKISRYVVWWRRRYGRDWPRFPQEEESALPNRVSRWRDWALYCGLRCRDRISPIIFSLTPIALLRRYREMKKLRREGTEMPLAGPVDAGGSSCATAIRARREGRP